MYILTPEDVKVLSSIVNSTRLTAHGLPLKRALARIDGDGFFLQREGLYIFFKTLYAPTKAIAATWIIFFLSC